MTIYRSELSKKPGFGATEGHAEEDGVRQGVAIHLHTGNTLDHRRNCEHGGLVSRKFKELSM